MNVWYWMTKKIFIISPDDYLTDAIRLMRDQRVRHLPVMKNDKLKGIISDRDIKEYSPSKATSLDIYELHYVLAKTKIKQIMKTRVISTTPDAPIEEAAMLLLDENIGCLPVVDGGTVVGIISDKDIFRAMVDITGIRKGGHRICVTIEDRPGSIREVADVIRLYGFGLNSILTSYDKVKPGYRDVVIRTSGNGDFKGMKQSLENTYKGAQVGKGSFCTIRENTNQPGKRGAS
jgi:acetoin utilization protein AcuB